MTNVEIIKVELACVQSDCHNKDNRVCDNCRLALPSAAIIRAYNNAIKALEENAELKADNNARKFAMAMSEKVEKQLREENATLKKQLEALSGDIPWSELKDVSEVTKQLTEAKELLNEFMRISKASDEDFEHDYSELIGDTEHFLKEVNYERF